MFPQVFGTFPFEAPTFLPGLEQVTGTLAVRPLHMNQLQRFLIIVWEDRVVELHFATKPIPSTTTTCNGTLVVVDESAQVKAEHDLYLEFAQVFLFQIPEIRSLPKAPRAWFPQVLHLFSLVFCFGLGFLMYHSAGVSVCCDWQRMRWCIL